MIEGNYFEDMFAHRNIMKIYEGIWGKGTPGVLAYPIGVLQLIRQCQVPFVLAREDNSKLSRRDCFSKVLIRSDGGLGWIAIDIPLKYGRAFVGDRPNASLRILQDGVYRAHRQPIRYIVWNPS